MGYFVRILRCTGADSLTVSIGDENPAVIRWFASMSWIETSCIQRAGN